MEILKHFFEWFMDITDKPKITTWVNKLNDTGDYRLTDISIASSTHKSQLRLTSKARLVIIDIYEPLIRPTVAIPAISLDKRAVLDVGGIIVILVPVSQSVLTVSLTEPSGYTDFDVSVKLHAYSEIKVIPQEIHNLTNIASELL